MTTVGVCEDDGAMRQIIRTALEQDGFTVRTTTTGADAVRAFSDCIPDVLLLDLGLPDADGRDVCQALRARGITAPVLFLTGQDALTERLSCFRSGGDDYLAKPFALSELVVRVQALVRRAALSAATREATVGHLLDPAQHAIGGETRVSLTPTEFRLLATACAAAGTVVRRGELVAAAWPDGAIVSDSTLDAYVSRIRSKLRRAGRSEALTNVRGVGYRLA